MYGKLIEGVLEYAPKIFTTSNGVIVNFNSNKDKMIEFGYKKIEDNIVEYNTIDEYLEASYKETEDKIIINYEVKPIDITEFKKEKIEQSKLILAQYLETHPLYSNCHGGEYDYYSVTQEKQNLLTSAYTSYMVLTQAGQTPVLTWNATGKPCEVWREEEMIQLIAEVQAYVYPLIKKQQLMEVEINNCTKTSELKEVNINFEEN